MKMAEIKIGYQEEFAFYCQWKLIEEEMIELDNKNQESK